MNAILALNAISNARTMVFVIRRQTLASVGRKLVMHLLERNASSKVYTFYNSSVNI